MENPNNPESNNADPVHQPAQSIQVRSDEAQQKLLGDIDSYVASLPNTVQTEQLASILKQLAA